MVEGGPGKVRLKSAMKDPGYHVKGFALPPAMGSHGRFQEVGLRPHSDQGRMWEAILTAVGRG